MMPAQMAADCEEALAAGSDGVVFTIPRRKMPRGFPRGELLNEVMRGDGVIERTVRLDPMKVLAWLTANRLITVSAQMISRRPPE